MPLYDVYGPRKAMAAREDTWGHLAPRYDHAYEGYILFATSPYASLGWTVIEDDFPGLENSPWQYEAMVDFLNDLADELGEGALYLWRGTFEFFDPKKDGPQYLDMSRYRFCGKARRVFVSGLPGSSSNCVGRKRAR
jgi:hypothetical protein